MSDDSIPSKLENIDFFSALFDGHPLFGMPAILVVMLYTPRKASIGSGAALVRFTSNLFNACT